jgi:gamma-glutamyltranspeptidase/glutathione hydrolase
MKPFRILFLLLFLIFTSCKAEETSNEKKQTNSNVIPNKQPSGDIYYNGAVSSADVLASQVGLDILKNGGNAIDAAVGIGFALAVVYPRAGNLGGGGFMVIHLADGTNTSIDYREKAPSGAFRDMYLDANGDVVVDLSTVGHLAAGVPGAVAGMLYSLEKYGTMSRQEVLKYAIDLADNGFTVSESLGASLWSYLDEFEQFPSTMKVFGNVEAGQTLVQKDLANTLRLISESGRDGFYKGPVAEYITAEMKRGNGIMTLEDLASYQPVERDVVKGTYRGYDIVSMGPPSSGGISLIYLLNILENYDLSSYMYGSAEMLNIMVEAMRRVYADRSEFMGDADFVNVPADILTSKKYASDRMKDFTMGTASKSGNVTHGDAYYKESSQTTHYSVADSSGNVVSVTTTINDNYGNKVVVDGAGFFLNNEMDDFVSKPGVPNMYGLLGSDANAIEPNKRMLSSMTPTIVLKDGKPFLATGSPGGGRIITAVLNNIVNIIDYGLPLGDAIDLPRFHHQWYPDEIQIERGMLTGEVVYNLVQMGYRIEEIRDFASIDAILFYPDGGMQGHSDRRGSGKAVGY